MDVDRLCAGGRIALVLLVRRQRSSAPLADPGDRTVVVWPGLPLPQIRNQKEPALDPYAAVPSVRLDRRGEPGASADRC